ncbi:MAG TPA: VOC family protein [Bryobacteraceae bacterium]|nr:VOC family protein [Bryobacteraceae bacterium]
METRPLISAVFLLSLAAGAGAQLPAPNAAGVGMGHLHLNVRDPAAHRAFWTTLGGTPVKLGGMEVIKFPDVLVIYQKTEPNGGTEGSVVGHIGFRVKDLNASLDKWRAAGLQTLPGASSHQAFVIAPDEIRVEMTEDPSMEVPIANHHIHFYTASVDETKAWYVKMFGAKPGKRGPFEAADVPGVNLTFSKAAGEVAGTKGRALDHIGFEVKDLEAFCKKLEAAGVKFDLPYRKIPSLGLSIAFLTDPWGTYIELTEGLNRL